MNVFKKTFAKIRYKRNTTKLSKQLAECMVLSEKQESRIRELKALIQADGQ